MMRKLGLLSLATLTVAAACTEVPTAVHAPLTAAFSGSGVYGMTEVHGSFTLVPGSVPPGVNHHPQGRGSCRNQAGVRNPFPNLANGEYTIYFNEQGQRTSNGFCQGSAGSGPPVACTIQAIPAYYGAENVQPGAGAPEYLVFDILHESANPERVVRYGSGPGAQTQGRGLVEFAFVCADQITGGGQLLLDQFFAPVNLFFSGAGTPNLSADDRQLTTTGIALSTSRGAGTLTSMFWSLGSGH